MMRIGRVLVLLAFGGLAAPLAQAQAVAADAPVPTQIASAKTVFISFGGADASLFPGFYSGAPDRVYSEFYSAMKAWGQYDLVLQPADADLVMQIRLIDLPADGAGGHPPVFQVTLLDPKTHVVLWVTDDYLKQAFALKKHRDRLFNESMSGVIDHLKALAARK
jgi:hypothetical protein